MRIAQVCHRYSPNVGGVERHVQEIAEMLAERHEVEVISADLAGGLPPSEVIKGVKVTRLRSLSPGEAYFFAPSIRSYLKKGGFDVVHAGVGVQHADGLGEEPEQRDRVVPAGESGADQYRAAGAKHAAQFPRGGGQVRQVVDDRG